MLNGYGKGKNLAIGHIVTPNLGKITQYEDLQIQR